MVQGIPDELKELLRWVVWLLELRDEKWTKVPYHVDTGRRASTTDPSTWSTFARAFAAYHVGLHDPGARRYDGIGFVFTAQDPYAGVDLDKVLDPTTGVLKPWARKIIEFLDSYTEVSPSGTGVKIFLRAKVPSGRRVVTLDGSRIEMYDQARYFTVTGHRLESLP
jgi:primase-polymerase (primpol)-like protein